MSIELIPIGVLHSCFKERFGTPRQAGRAPAARGWIEFHPPYDREEAFVGLDGFSHLWLLFLFHENLAKEIPLSVQPPHAEGKTYGLWATRTPHRPSGIGQSLVELDCVERSKGKVRLQLKGIDLIEGTPIIDIKPYLPYVDAIPEARSPFLQQPPEPELHVSFSARAEQQLGELEGQYPELRPLIVQVLQYDPRPVEQQHDNGQGYTLRLYDLRLSFEIRADRVKVLELAPA